MNRRNERAITLIALVVTIVVLLILAGVSISMLTGENGIITQAGKAKENARAGEINELKSLWLYERRTAEETNQEVKTLSTFLSELVQDGHISEEEKNEIMTNKKLEIGEQTITFEEEKEIVIVEPENPEDWDFVSNGDGTITITNYIGDDTEVIIPNYIGGYPVKAIKPTKGPFSATNNIGGLISLWDYSIRRKFCTIRKYI